MESVTIRRPDDFHVHLRDGDMLKLVTRETAKHFARSLVMPNVPAIEDYIAAVSYGYAICSAAGSDFQPLLSIKLTHRTTPQMIREAQRGGVVAAKIYPTGVTTGSDDGISDPRSKQMCQIYAAMQDCGMVLCIHGEEPSAFVLDREVMYLNQVAWIIQNFPGLKVVLEHITTEQAVDFIRVASVNVAATITAHHLTITLNDLIGDGIRPHLYCKPVPKRYKDRTALINAAIYQDNSRCFLGTDSAPHTRLAKESACGCAGVFSAPVALSVLADLFFRDGVTDYMISALQSFTSERGADFYGLPRNEGTITLLRDPWTVPDSYGDVVPFRAGETLSWRVLS